MPLCALAVHQLRYYLAFGGQAPVRLSRDGHAYLSTIEPFALLCCALALGGLIGGLARAWQSPSATEPASPRLLRLWAACAVTLLVIYCAQELLEGLFAPGHPAGIAGIVGHGGWIAAPVAALIGAALAATLKMAQTLIDLTVRVQLRRRGQDVPAPARRQSPRTTRDWRLDPQSGVAAGRAPPLALARR